jgi:hypothetical protein
LPPPVRLAGSPDFPKGPQIIAFSTTGFKAGKRLVINNFGSIGARAAIAVALPAILG